MLHQQCPLTLVMLLGLGRDTNLSDLVHSHQALGLCFTFLQRWLGDVNMALFAQLGALHIAHDGLPAIPVNQFSKVSLYS